MKWFTRKIEVNELLDNEKISANKAYMISKYGEEKTKEQLLKEFFMSARNMIQLKSERQQYSVILELNDDIKEYLPKIVEHYKMYGYNVIVIDENTNIMNEYNTASSRITMTLIVVTWDNPTIEQITDNND